MTKSNLFFVFFRNKLQVFVTHHFLLFFQKKNEILNYFAWTGTEKKLKNLNFFLNIWRTIFEHLPWLRDQKREYFPWVKIYFQIGQVSMCMIQSHPMHCVGFVQRFVLNSVSAKFWLWEHGVNSIIKWSHWNLLMF